jgi:transcriptional regulator with XRE-family HTH domain
MKQMSRNVFDKETLTKIGSRIREARGNSTQAHFASQIGVGRTVLANYEAGRRLPDSETLEKISSQSGIAVRYLLFGELTIPVPPLPDSLSIGPQNEFAVAVALAIFHRLKKPQKGYSKRNDFFVWAEVLPLVVSHFEGIIEARARLDKIGMEDVANATIANILAADESDLQGILDGLLLVHRHLLPHSGPQSGPQ